MFQQPTAIVIASRQRELRHEADQERLARLAGRTRPTATPESPALRMFAVRLGRLVAAR